MIIFANQSIFCMICKANQRVWCRRPGYKYMSLNDLRVFQSLRTSQAIREREREMVTDKKQKMIAKSVQVLPLPFPKERLKEDVEYCVQSHH